MLHCRAAAAGFALLAVSGCAFTGIDIMRDTRVAMLSPADGDTVEVPFTVTWRLEKPIAPGREVSYAVFVDRTAIKPGQDVRAVVPEEDRQCRSNPTCPDADYLARRGVYVVNEPQVTVPRVTVTKERTAHRVTVVILLDGKRDGEGSFSRTVYVDGDDS